MAYNIIHIFNIASVLAKTLIYLQQTLKVGAIFHPISIKFEYEQEPNPQTLWLISLAAYPKNK